MQLSSFHASFPENYDFYRQTAANSTPVQRRGQLKLLGLNKLRNLEKGIGRVQPALVDPFQVEILANAVDSKVIPN